MRYFMKRCKRIAIFSLLFFLVACVNEPFYDVYKSVENRQWHRKEKQIFHVHVKENSRPYDVWMYIRHTGEYDFENLFFIFSQQGPGIPTSSYKQKLNLATPDGRWTGKTAGNLYENRLLLQKNYIFPDTGLYVFEIAQHMHENPIRNITDIGLKIVVK